jgi:hypothetical protein
LNMSYCRIDCQTGGFVFLEHETMMMMMLSGLYENRTWHKARTAYCHP